MTAENPPGSWPLPEDVALPDENDDESLIDGNSIRGQEASDIQENVVENKGLGKGSLKKKHGMMALPSEIRETYAFQLTALRMPLTGLIVLLLMPDADF